MDSVTHGSVSVLIGLIFIQFYKDVPLILLILVIFVFGILIDYDHVFYYRKNYEKIKFWDIPGFIRLYFKTIDQRDRNINHSWLHEPFGVVMVSGLSYLIFGFTPYPELVILAISCYVGHFLVDLISGKMKPFSPFNNKITIDLHILPANSFTAATLSLVAFLIGLTIQLLIS